MFKLSIFVHLDSVLAKISILAFNISRPMARLIHCPDIPSANFNWSAAIQNHPPDWSMNGFPAKNHIVVSNLYVVPEPKVKLVISLCGLNISMFFSRVGLLALPKPPDPEVILSDFRESLLILFHSGCNFEMI